MDIDKAEIHRGDVSRSFSGVILDWADVISGENNGCVGCEAILDSDVVDRRFVGTLI